jgi:hypothetical protein
MYLNFYIKQTSIKNLFYSIDIHHHSMNLVQSDEGRIEMHWSDFDDNSPSASSVSLIVFTWSLGNFTPCPDPIPVKSAALTTNKANLFF